MEEMPQPQSEPETDVSGDWLSPMPAPDCMIRLLRLPQGLDDGGGIVLKVDTYSLEEVPVYYALSYTWGCPFVTDEEFRAWEAMEVKNPVVCNGKVVQVTKSLRVALKAIIHLNPGCLLWNDALCIDQQNIEEKLTHINMMGEIYSRAIEVICWLGSRLGAIAALHKLYNRLLSVGDLAHSSVSEEQEIMQSQIFGDTDFAFRQQTARSVIQIWSLRWWKRKWTFQEYVLARTVTMVYGDFVFKTEPFLKLMDLLPQSSERDVGLRRVMQMQKRKAAFQRTLFPAMVTEPTSFISKLDAAYKCHNPAAILMDLLVHTVGLQVTEPRDMILSMVGLVKELAQRLKQPYSYHFIKSDMSLMELTVAVTKEAILTMPYLTALRFVHDRELKTGQPSWLPNFSVALGTFSDQEYKAGRYDSYQNDYYLASRRFGLFPDPVSPSAEKERLALNGVRLGSIMLSLRVRTGGTEDVKSTYLRRELEALRAMLIFCFSLPHSYWAEGSFSDRLWRTMFFGTPVSQERFRLWASATLFESIQETPGFTLESFMSSITSTSDIKLSDILGFDIVTDYYNFARRIFASNLPGRAALAQVKIDSPKSDISNLVDSFLLSIGEERIGITALPCQEHDEVWILLGAEYPSIVRPLQLPGYFQLIGEAYVDGVMHGEFINDRGGEPGWETIWLV